MSETITRARDSFARGASIPLIRALDELLERGQAAEEGLAAESEMSALKTSSRAFAYTSGYRTATLELANHLAEAILKAASE